MVKIKSQIDMVTSNTLTSSQCINAGKPLKTKSTLLPVQSKILLAMISKSDQSNMAIPPPIIIPNML